MFDADKTKMIGLYLMMKKLSRYVKPFSSDTGTLRTDIQTDGQKDIYINIAIQYAEARYKNTGF